MCQAWSWVNLPSSWLCFRQPMGYGSEKNFLLSPTKTSGRLIRSYHTQTYRIYTVYHLIRLQKKQCPLLSLSIVQNHYNHSIDIFIKSNFIQKKSCLVTYNVSKKNLKKTLVISNFCCLWFCVFHLHLCVSYRQAVFEVEFVSIVSLSVSLP